MFVDEADITITGGHGGAGLVSFGKMAHSGPDGGNGGKGGDVYLLAESDITLLAQFTRKIEYSAQAGEPGGKNRRSGKNGDDLIIKLPIGTSVFDKATDDLIVELKFVGQQEIICSGGKGGRGNFEFRSPRHTTPMISQPGLPGDEKKVRLILKLIADFGLIGLPNSGKSSLLNELTNSNVKTANYAFTTLTPNLGVLKGKVIADIPGLIEGASVGRGLGISFLKHIEKVGVLLHCISAESTDSVKDYKTIRKELKKYNEKLLDKREIILITKSDLSEPNELKKIKTKINKYCKEILFVSIHDWESLEALSEIIAV